MAIKWNGEKLGPGSNLNTPPATILSVAANENQGDSSKKVSKKTKKDEDDQPENVSTPGCSLVGVSMGAADQNQGAFKWAKGHQLHRAASVAFQDTFMGHFETHLWALLGLS